MKFLCLFAFVGTYVISLFHSPSADYRPVTYSIQADYLLTYLPDSTKKEFKEEYMELLINSNESVFRGKKQAVMDSLFKASAEGTGNDVGMMRTSLTPIRYHIYKIGDSVVTQEEYQLLASKKSFYVESGKFDWKISEDTAAIAGLKCQMATMKFGGREWIAWFAQEIPLNEGPYKFCGLPGLIVRIYDSKKQWSFDMISLKEQNRAAFVEFDRNRLPKFTSKKQFFKAKKYYIRNRTKMEEASGFIASMDEKTRSLSYQRDEARANADNNWIELYDAGVK